MTNIRSKSSGLVPVDDAVDIPGDIAGTPAAVYAPVAESESIDLCSSMFDLCKRCQDDFLDSHGLTCMFDVDGGRVPVWMGQMLQAIVEMLVRDIANSMQSRIAGAAVGVTVRRSGGFWALAVAENVSRESGPARAGRRLTMVRALTDRLECICRVLPNPSGSTIAIAIPARSVPGRDQQSLLTSRVLH